MFAMMLVHTNKVKAGCLPDELYDSDYCELHFREDKVKAVLVEKLDRSSIFDALEKFGVKKESMKKIDKFKDDPDIENIAARGNVDDGYMLDYLDEDQQGQFYLNDVELGFGHFILVEVLQ